MKNDTAAAIIANDLDSMAHRIEELEAHPRYTDALNHVTEAKQAVIDARMAIHQQNMRARFAEADAP